MQRDRITCLLGEQRGTKYQTAREVSSALLTQGARRNRYSPNSVFLPPIPACSATNMPPEPGRSPSTEASSDAEHDQVLGETATTALTAEGAAEIFKMKRDHVIRDTMSAKVCADHARLAARCVCHACVHFRLRANNASACLASC